jgi:hypothetical protein
MPTVPKPVPSSTQVVWNALADQLLGEQLAAW